jgi:hypothetical protein
VQEQTEIGVSEALKEKLEFHIKNDDKKEMNKKELEEKKAHEKKQ